LEFEAKVRKYEISNSLKKSKLRKKNYPNINFTKILQNQSSKIISISSKDNDVLLSNFGGLID
jgi:hypothetical protein